MLIQKNVKTSFLLNAGRRRSTVDGWSAAYQLLNKSGDVIFPSGGGYSTQSLQEIGNGLYGVAITFGTTYCGYIRWKISKGTEDVYTVEPYTVLSSYGNKGVEQTFIANFGVSRTGKDLDYRILKDDLTEERTWSKAGLIEIGNGIYGAALTINTAMTGYIEWRNNTDGLNVSDPILIFDTLNAPIIQMSDIAVSVETPSVSIALDTMAVDVAIDNHDIDIAVSDPELDIEIGSDPEVNVS